MTHLVGENDLPDVLQVIIGEHETNVALDVREDFLQLRILVKVPTNGLTDGSVLAHHDSGSTTQRDTDLLHLLRAHIVHVHKKHS